MTCQHYFLHLIYQSLTDNYTQAKLCYSLRLISDPFYRSKIGAKLGCLRCALESIGYVGCVCLFTPSFIRFGVSLLHAFVLAEAMSMMVRCLRRIFGGHSCYIKRCTRRANGVLLPGSTMRRPRSGRFCSLICSLISAFAGVLPQPMCMDTTHRWRRRGASDDNAAGCARPSRNISRIGALRFLRLLLPAPPRSDPLLAHFAAIRASAAHLAPGERPCKGWGSPNVALRATRYSHRKFSLFVLQVCNFAIDFHNTL
jgi:hypothetical protein